jgi:sugar-specific transcriptional regulator TrmB
MNEDLIKHVEELGLSNKEARVYIANLMLGPAGVQQIADTSGIKRVTTYVILEALVNLGLVSQTSHAKKTLFNAEAPDNLHRLLEKREQSLRDQKQQLEELLPQLKKLKTLPKTTPTIKFYDGNEGIRTVVKTVIQESKEAGVKQVYGVSNLDELHTVFPEIAAAETNPDRVSAGIRSRIIYTSDRGPIYEQGDTNKLRESRYVSSEDYPIHGDMAIVGDRVAMVSFAGIQPIGVIIQSPELSQMLLNLFNLAWERLS